MKKWLRDKLRKWLGIEELAYETKRQRDLDYRQLYNLILKNGDRIETIGDDCVLASAYREMWNKLCDKCDEIKSIETGLKALRKRTAKSPKKAAQKKAVRKS